MPPASPSSDANPATAELAVSDFPALCVRRTGDEATTSAIDRSINVKQ
jgi:hypothetical protein